jgi:signal peptide peptidase SppA
VDRIVLDINSPGGHVRGVPELSRKIAAWNGQKRIRASIDGIGCSAAYYLAAGCHSIFALETSDVGSIGVVSAFVDESQAYAAAGRKVVMFTGGKLKGAGIPGTALTPEMQAHLQERTLLLYEAFKSHVSTYRKRVPADAMEGQSFLGSQAAKNGLVDGLVDNLNEVIAKR